MTSIGSVNDRINIQASGATLHPVKKMWLNEITKPRVSDLSDFEDLVRQHRKGFIVPVDCDAVIISEIQRCGGTLLTQLFDGHKNLHVHPSEVQIGRPNKYHWPNLEHDLPADVLFENLKEVSTGLHATEGYFKVAYTKKGIPEYRNDVLPFMFSEALQREVFETCIKTREIHSQREILDCYITSYFNAWIDYQGLYRSPASIDYWVGFVPRIYIENSNVERFFNDYPSGKFILLSRHPVSWFASARNHMPKQYEDIVLSVDLWKTATTRALALAKQYPSRVKLVAFENLVREPIQSQARLGDFLGLSDKNFNDIPTFNGMPIKADTSFVASKFGIIKDAIDRSSYLNKEEILLIEQLAIPTYEEFVKVAGE